jgi:hypothetical protein
LISSRFQNFVILLSLVGSLLSLATAPSARALDGPIYDFQAANYNASNGQWTNAGSISETTTVTAKNATFPTKNSTPNSVELTASTSGSTNGYQFIVGPQQTNAVAQAFTISAWFKTTAGGGKIIGMEGDNVPESGLNGYDKNLYIDAAGRLAFATQYPKRITSTLTVNNNQWQHAVATYTGTTTAGATSNEVKLYLNGQLVGTQIGAALVPTGYWRIGGYTMNGWTSNGYFSGSISRASIHNRVLSSAEVSADFSSAKSTYGIISCGTSGIFWVQSNAVTGSQSCTGSLTIPEGVTAVNGSAFYGASGLTSVSLPSTLLTIGSSAFRTTSVSTVVIPASVTSIGELAFSINAVNFTSVTFSSPSSLTTLGNYAFQYSDFTSITIPASVTNMGTDVFNANDVLTSIYFLGNKPGGSTSDIYRKASITVFKTSNATGFSSTWLGATVVSPPEAPTSLSATAGDAQVSIAFTAGANNGDTLSNYKYSLDGTTYTALSPSDTTTPVVIPGLTNGTSYTITLKAVNTAGESVASSSVTATPVAPVTVISVAAIGGVTAPVRAATPVTTVTAANGYTGTVTWSGSPTTFAASTSYTATITLTAASGYTLTGVTANFFTVAGATSVTHSANSGVITAVFPTTAAIVSDNSTTEKVDTGPPPSFLKVKTPPTISLIADIYTCTAGTLIFWRFSVTEEPSKLSYQKISLLRDGTEVASSVTLKSLATFEKIATWTGSTMTCQVYAAQENTVGTFSSVGADKYNELAKSKATAIKAAEAKHSTDRKAAYNNRRVELSRISDVRASELKAAKTSAQKKAASEKYRLAFTRTSETWKAELKAAPARRESSIALAQATFTQGLASMGFRSFSPNQAQKSLYVPCTW